MARTTGPKKAATKPRPAPKKAGTKKVKKAVILAVDNGEAYNFKFRLKKKQIIRVVGKNLVKGATVRLSSHKVQWVEFRHTVKVVAPAPHLGKHYQMVLLRDTPKPRAEVKASAAAAGKPPKSGGGDSGDLIITVTNTGAPATIKTNEVLYALD